jgi:hypothetical protein
LSGFYYPELAWLIPITLLPIVNSLGRALISLEERLGEEVELSNISGEETTEISRRETYEQTHNKLRKIHRLLSGLT